MNTACNWLSQTIMISVVHRRTGLEILGGGVDMNLPDSRTSRGFRGHAPEKNFEK